MYSALISVLISSFSVLFQKETLPRFGCTSCVYRAQVGKGEGRGTWKNKKAKPQSNISCRTGTLFSAKLWNTPSLSDCNVIVHKSCKECAPVCTKVSSCTAPFLLDCICFSRDLEMSWRKKRHTSSTDPSVCVQRAARVSKRLKRATASTVLELQFLEGGEKWV